MLRKAAGILVVIFIALWVSRDPTAAGDSVHHWVNGILAFMQHAG
jgi:hypothetical protein